MASYGTFKLLERTFPEGSLSSTILNTRQSYKTLLQIIKLNKHVRVTKETIPQKN